MIREVERQRQREKEREKERERKKFLSFKGHHYTSVVHFICKDTEQSWSCCSITIYLDHLWALSMLGHINSYKIKLGSKFI